jgi:hypothetical protein
LNAWTNLYETWYVCHGTWAHLNGVLHKSLPSVCMSLCVSLLSLLGKGSVKCIPPFVARQRLSKYNPAGTNTRNSRRIVGRVIFYAILVVSKENGRLVVPRTSCFCLWKKTKGHFLLTS